MPSANPPAAGGRIAFRCDGDGQIGAGHVARCLPLAAAFAQLGWEVCFVGAYDGLAAWLLARTELNVRPPDLAASCGVASETCDAAVLDSYAIAPSAICELARMLPVVTLAEANRCPNRGVLLDYHLDATGRSDAHLLAGPTFAPLDPAFAGAGRAGQEVRRVLVTVGGSLRARELLDELVPTVGSVFPHAELVLAGGGRPETYDAFAERMICPPSPSALVDVVSEIDMAVTAAGLTAYEMASAGIPQLAIAIAANQRRVVRGSLAELPAGLERLRDPELRRLLGERGRTAFDGKGAQRAASRLTELFATGEAARAAPSTTADGRGRLG
jgi:UDP-2,4-diacetamido-2,4,6-trideoxy-beta-L-altropyranose hydrolase